MFKNLKIISSEIYDINVFIKKTLDSNIPILKKILDFYNINKGKNIRSIISIVISHLYYEINNNYQFYIRLFSMIELIHLSSLLHDDVIDNASLRRSNITTNKKFGNSISILTGDLIFTRAFNIAVYSNNKKILQELSKTVEFLLNGEFLQNQEKNNINITLNKYIDIIYYKTGKLFELSALIGSFNKKKSFYRKKSILIGKHIGIAYQMIDDIKDIFSNNTNKNKYNDIHQGRITLPIILLIKKLSDKQKNIFKKVFFEKNIKIIKKFLCEYNILNESKKVIGFYLTKAKNIIEKNYNKILLKEYKQLLFNIIQYLFNEINILY